MTSSPLVNQVVSSDLLTSAKMGVRNLAHAITETATPELRRTLIKHLNDAITFYERVADYMIRTGQYAAYDLTKQLSMDIENADKVINSAQ